MNDKTSLYSTILLFTLLVITMIYNTSNITTQKIDIFIPKTYKRCNDQNKTMDPFVSDLFARNNIIHNNNTWDIYYPCGYNDIEQQLHGLHISNKNQIIFGISGTDNIVSKNGLWQLLYNKYRHNANKIMPQTYVLNNTEDMKLFEQSYSPNKIYIIKKNIQQKKGIKLTQNLYEIKNARNDNFRVVQHYITNPFLINKRKINIRLYLLITSYKGKVKAYVHKQGKIIYANKDYTNNIHDIEANITSINLNQDIYKTNPLTYTELLVYLKKNNYNTDILHKNIITLMKSILISSHHKLGKLKTLTNNHCFQLYGADIILNKQLVPYLLELNKGPDMQPKSYRDKSLKSTVKYDMFTLVKIINPQDKEYKHNFKKIF
jgi:hypothetical protein